MRRAAALLVCFTGLAVLHTWPLAGNLTGLSRLDNDDAGLNVWIVAWVAHILPRQPLDLFDAPIFHPEPRTLAYSEHLLVPSLMGAPLLWAGWSPVTVYNVLVIAGFALSGWTMALVVRAWTGSTLAGLVGGMLYAFNAHQLTRLVHLQALHIEFLPVALYGLDTLLRAPAGGARPPALVLAAGFVLQSLCSNYTLVFLAFALIAAAMVRRAEWLGTGHAHRRRAMAWAAVASAAALTPFLWPYYRVSIDQGLVRPIDEVARYSAWWPDYVATGGRLHFAGWSHRFFEGRTALFPGVAATALAVAALATPARHDPRARMMAVIGAMGVALSLGPALPGYRWLHDWVPLLQGIRGAARWGMLGLTAVAVLAAYAMARLERRWHGRTGWPAVALVLILVVTLEALRAPMGFVPAPAIPPLYDRLRAEPDAVVVELPLFAGPSVSENARYLLHSTRHFRPMVNGYSGFESAGFRDRAARWRAFPAAEVLDEMRAIGVTHVVVDTGELTPDQVEGAASSPGLALLENDGRRRLYRLVR